jgi:hypothetical protein
MQAQWGTHMGRRLSLGVTVSVLLALGAVPTTAFAFPGESAYEMIGRHGPPSLPHSVQLPPKAMLQAGKTPSVLVVWFQTKYHPLSIPMEMEGRVVASFRFDSDTALNKLQKGEVYATWTDLRSDFENLFTTLSKEDFDHFLTALDKEWALTKLTHHQDPPYDLYEAVSKDRRLKAELSFRTPGVPSASATDPYYGGKFPDGNVWIRVERIKQ